MIFGYFTLFVALILSAVAAYYSIVGLTAIFSAAVIPIVIMGASLEIGKVTAAVWLKLNWHRASLTYKLYLVPALVFLMLLTSMGIFGFLSKAHSDQSLVSGDVTSKIAIYDEKIKTEKENIEANRKALKQMDEGVDQVLGRSADEKGADKAVALRRSQQKERARLQAEISQSQKSIAELGDARAPIAAEVRKVEAEVGPIKYIAAFIYGDNPDANLLEKAVTWVIIIIVAVFDPLALVLILAAQQSLKWERQAREDRAAMGIVPPDVVTRPFTPEEIAALDETEPDPKYNPDDGPLTTDQVEQIKKTLAEQHPYLAQPFVHFKNLTPIPAPATVRPDTDIDELDNEQELPYVKEAIKKWKAVNPDDTIKNQRHMLSRGEIAELPWMALIKSLPEYQAVHSFGTQLPGSGNKGDTYIRTDQVPNRLFKHNGQNWIELDKTISDSYTYNTAYIDYLIDKIARGEYDPDLLSDRESEQVALHLQQRQ